MYEEACPCNKEQSHVIRRTQCKKEHSHVIGRTPFDVIRSMPMQTRPTNLDGYDFKIRALMEKKILSFKSNIINKIEKKVLIQN